MLIHESDITEEEIAKLEALLEKEIETGKDYRELGVEIDEDE